MRATLVQLDTLRNTRSGNPRYRAHLQTEQGVIQCVTRPDSTFSYQITNYLNKGSHNWIVVCGLVIGVRD